MRARVQRWLLLTGAGLLLLAMLWWGIVFRSVLSFDYLTLPQALVCLGRSDSICELAMSLCSTRIRHFLDITRYWPGLLWCALALMFASLSLLKSDAN